MAWVKIDDQAPRHHKMLTAGPAACWLWVCGLAHCQSQLTDGFISKAAIGQLGLRYNSSQLAQRLIAAGLWTVVDGGYQVHDYLSFNNTRDEALLQRAHLAGVRAGAGRVGGRVSGAQRRATQGLATMGATLDGLNGTIEHTRTLVKQTAKQTIEAKRSPDPSHPDLLASAKQEHDRAREPARLNSPIIGKNPHRMHALCDETHAYCVPAAVHHKLADLLAPKHGGDHDRAADALLAWYPTVWAKLVAGFVMGEAFRFWQGRFDEAFATTAPAVAVRMFNAPTQDDVDAQLVIIRRRDKLLTES